ncbi:TniQ family protein [Kitasatospora sp. NPDC028055]|uniref:TniQ family protein n=1 Tax=Kitasatospora sp. NPDC028055 TaxID=3155653 RepID=UPI0033CB251E
MRSSGARRRLPAVAVPCPEEAFDSWLWRAAYRIGVAPGFFARALGLDLSGVRQVRPVGFGVCLSLEAAERLEACTGIPAGRFTGMQLANVAVVGAPVGKLTVSRLREWQADQWVSVYGGRVCPLCVADVPVSRLWWRLSAAAVCPVHRCLLVDECAGCGRRVQSGRAQLGMLPVREGALDPGVCGNVLAGSAMGRCEARLSDLPVTVVGDILVVWQRPLLEAFAGRPVRALGDEVSPRQWFAGVRLVTELVREAATAAELEDLGMPSSGRGPGAWLCSVAGEVRGRVGSPPASALEAAFVLRTAGSLLTGHDPQDAAGRLRSWADRLVRSGAAKTVLAPNRRDVPRLVAAAVGW